MARCAVYQPPEPGLPHLAVVIAKGKVVACEPVKSAAEGKVLLTEVTRAMPEFIAEAEKARH